MKVGDLVKIKYDVWAKAKPKPTRPQDHIDVGLVFSIAGKGLKVLMPDGKIKIGLIDQWEVLV